MIVWTELFFRFAIWDAWPISPDIWDTIVMMLFYSHCVQWTLCEDVGEGVGDSPERTFNLIKFIKIFGLEYPFLTNKMILWITQPSKKIWTRACIYKKMFNALFMCLTLFNLPTVTQIFLKLSNLSEVCLFYRNKWYGLNESNSIFLMNLLIYNNFLNHLYRSFHPRDVRQSIS